MTASSSPGPFGLAPSLRIPIAAANLTAIRCWVGTFTPADMVLDPSLNQKIGAVRVRARIPAALPRDSALWRHPSSRQFFDVLYAQIQLWVHVDFKGYRDAWQRKMTPVASTIFLDHISNRRVTRLRDNTYPYIRLCPVPGQINTNAGHRAGGEGMEFEYTRQLRGSLSNKEWAQRKRELRLRECARGLVYADPMDLVKMLGISPGTRTLDGVRDFQHWFYDSY